MTRSEPEIGPITTYYQVGESPRWHRTWLGRKYTAWRGRRQMRGWVILGATDENRTVYDYTPEKP
jgi:hypothetical protein